MHQNLTDTSFSESSERIKSRAQAALETYEVFELFVKLSFLNYFNVCVQW